MRADEILEMMAMRRLLGDPAIGSSCTERGAFLGQNLGHKKSFKEGPATVVDGNGTPPQGTSNMPTPKF